MIKRSECTCSCHNNSGIIHCVPCCAPDSVAFEQSEKHKLWLESPEGANALNKLVEHLHDQKQKMIESNTISYNDWVKPITI